MIGWIVVAELEIAGGVAIPPAPPEAVMPPRNVSVTKPAPGVPVEVPPVADIADPMLEAPPVVPTVTEIFCPGTTSKIPSAYPPPPPPAIVSGWE